MSEVSLHIDFGVVYKRIEIHDVAPQLWISQTPKLVRAYHHRGTFPVPEVEDVAADIKTWEESNQEDLRKLAAALISKIIGVVKGCGGNAIVKNDILGDKLVIWKVDRKKMLPNDLYSIWDDNSEASSDNDVAAVKPANGAAPSSTFICGSRGSHFDAGGSPCEAAFLSLNPRIKVRQSGYLLTSTPVESLLEQTNMRTYHAFRNIKIEPLRISERALSSKRMLDLMAVSRDDGPMLLSVHSLSGLRLWKALCQTHKLEPRAKDERARLQSSTEMTGLLSRVGSLLSISLAYASLRRELARSSTCACPYSSTGRIVALDEAHKFMNESAEAQALTVFPSDAPALVPVSQDTLHFPELSTLTLDPRVESSGQAFLLWRLLGGGARELRRGILGEFFADVRESGNKLTEIMAHSLKEQQSAGHHPMIPVVDHTSIFCCKMPPRERAKWRTECREKLANHIHSQLGLTILPTDVKLITKPEDLYQWSILTAGKAALFNKQLSKHSTGAYIDLCNGVGVHFKAVLAEGAADYGQQTRLVTTSIAFDALEKSREHPSSDIITSQLSAKEWRERFNAEVAIRRLLRSR
ncbi:hypothetical protein V493_00551 [Pseudogymnoascus sp. VKM F-4281 (FW-2241)]|nr:hypothetical protein V493_00551 [Pseudogymnoascus sp. VKM F-4281 (FW-2241)]